VGPGWIIADLFASSIIGVVIDAATGAWSSLSQSDVFAAFGAGAMLAPTLPPLPPGEATMLVRWPRPRSGCSRHQHDAISPFTGYYCA